MNKAELVADISAKTGKTKTEVGDIVDALFDAITAALKAKDDVRIPNFGVFSVVETAARTARNPQTNEPVSVPAGKKARFRPGKGLKDALEIPPAPPPKGGGKKGR